MNPIDFPQANAIINAPPDLAESQCHSIKAFVSQIEGGSMDGARQIVVAWKPDERELEFIKSGEPIFVSFLGGIPPHYLSTTFEEATHPA